MIEDNHVMFKFRSDSQTTLSSVEKALFEDTSNAAYIGDLFDLTSKRMGFAGRGSTPEHHEDARAPREAPPAPPDPDFAQLSMGFTSTQTQALGPGNLPSFETLRGVTDQYPAGYFAAGCAMHLSHLYLDLPDVVRPNPDATYTGAMAAMFNPRVTATPRDADGPQRSGTGVHPGADRGRRH